jgi:branched-chain amino acid transport system permease protein
VAIAATLVILATLGVLVERVAVRPFLRASSIAWLLSTIALGIIAENVAMLTFGKDARAFPSALTRRPWNVLGAGVYPHELLVPIAGLIIMAAVELAFRRTMAGKALRAVAFSHDAAGLMGINVTRTITVAYVLSSLLAGIAGILLAPLLNVSATMGTTIGLKAFAVAIIGGIESARGIVVAGVLYGVLEAVVAGFLGTGVREIVGFAVVILVLLIRPSGLFGIRALRRV